MAEAGKGDGVEDITVTSDTSDTSDTLPPGGGRNFGEGIEGGERRGGGEGRDRLSATTLAAPGVWRISLVNSDM